MEKLITSHSEITSFNECELQHTFAHILNLRPHELSTPLQFGIPGHKILETYYKTLQATNDFTAAFLQAFKTFDELKHTLDHHVAGTLEIHLQMYFKKYRRIPWRIIEVETSHHVTLEDKPYDYGFRTDLIVEILEGQHKGKIAIVDHKFTYNFYTIGDYLLNAQIARYLWGVRKNGIDADLGILAQIRWRSFKDYSKADLFKHEPITPTDTRIENIMQQFYRAGDEVYRRHQMSRKEAISTAKLALSKQVCKNCDFQEPCSKRLDGEDYSRLLAINYKKSDYGYN